MSRTTGSPLYVLMVSLVAALSGLLFGYDTTIINGALVFLRDAFHMTTEQVEYAASALLVGCLFGAATAGGLSDRFGRKWVLALTGAVFAISSILTALPHSLLMFVAARFVAGLAIGVASVIAPMYIAEVAPARARGFLVSLNQLMIVSGILAAYVVSYFLKDFGALSWRLMFASAAIPSLALMLGVLAIPESPRWLMSKGREDAARAVIHRVESAAVSETDIEAMRHLTGQGEDGWWSKLARVPKTRMMVALLVCVFSQITGINAILYYGSIFITDHITHDVGSSLGINVAIGAVNFVFTIVAMALIDRAGRKALLLCGALVMSVAMFGLMALLESRSTNVALIVGCILAYIAAFATSFGPVTWVLISELFDTKSRATVMSIATAVLWLSCLGLTSTFLTVVKALGIAGAFGLFGGVCFLALVFVWLAVPETRGEVLDVHTET